MVVLIAQAITALAARGGLVAAGFSDGTVRLYSEEGLGFVAAARALDWPVKSLSWLGDTLIAAGGDQIRLLDTAGNFLRALPQEEGSEVLGAWAWDGKVVSVDREHPLRVWNPKKGRLAREAKLSGEEITLSPQCACVAGDFLYVGFENWGSHIYDLKKRGRVKELEVYSPVKHPACASDGELLVFSETPNLVIVLRLGSWDTVKVLETPGLATALALGGGRLYLGLEGGEVLAYDTESWELRWRHELDKGRVNALALGEKALYAGAEKGLAVLPK